MRWSRAAFLAVIALLSLTYFLNLPYHEAFSTRELMNAFFGADCWRVLENLKNRDVATNHYRDVVHPFFSIVAVSIAGFGRGLSAPDGPFLVYRAVFGTLACVLFWDLLERHTDRPTAIAATVLLFSTMTLRVWSVLPESYLFGFFTIMLGLELADRQAPAAAVMLATMAGTITNGVLGILHAIRASSGPRAFVRTCFQVAFAATLLAVAQRNIYPTSEYFFRLSALREDAHYLTASHVPFRIFDTLVSGFLLPIDQPVTLPVTSEGLWRIYLHRVIAGERFGVTVAIAATVILGLLAGAGARWWRGPREPLTTLVAAFLVFELALHAVYGDLPFLYSLHVTPLLVLFVAVVCRDRAMPVVLLGLALLLQINNLWSAALLGL